jgi:hypothetical protein
MAEKNRSFSEAAKDPQKGVMGEFVHFIAHNKKWWLTPIVVILLLVSLLVVLGSSGAAPFIYSLF